MSDSEESRKDEAQKAEGAAGEAAAPAPEGAVIAEAEGEAKDEKDAEGDDAGKLKPSNTLRISNLPDDMDISELEPRLQRHGDLVSVHKEEGSPGVAVAKFQRTNDAFEARQALDGKEVNDNVIKVEFGPQDADHYARTKKGRASKAAEGTTKEDDDAKEDAAPAGGKRKKAEADEAPAFKRPKGEGLLDRPVKAVSKWSEELSFEAQLEDFMKMARRGMYNRYLVLGKLPPELRTGSAIWQLAAPVQRDVMHIEMVTCFGKPVAHVALRSATAAAALHRIAEQTQPNLTVAFAPPRRASKALWLGNVDDFVNRKDLEVLLGDFGKLQNGMRYLPARTCAFATFTEVAQAVKARNWLYGLEVQKNQYLNVDFVDEGWAEAQEGMAAMGQMPGAWGMPPMPPWGMPPGPWGMPPMAGGGPPGWQKGKGGGRRGDKAEAGQWPDPWGRGGMPAMPGMFPGMPGMPGMFPGMPGAPGHGAEDRDGKRGRRGRDASRSPRRGRDASQEPPPRRGGRDQGSPAAGGRRKAAAPAPAAASDSEAPEATQPKTRVKLYKMGEFCCNIVANFVKGKDDPEALNVKLHIDQRTKIDHCKSHLDRAGALATIWHFSAADRKDCAAYDALCDYFVEKQRVGLVQTPSCYVYIVPPTEKYLKVLKLPNSNFVVGLQIPIKK